MNVKLLSLLGFVSIIMISLSGCIDSGNGGSWIWYFQADTWAEVTFRSEQLICAGSDAPEDIFAEAVDLGYEVGVYQQQNGEWKGWSSEIDPVYNNLYHILPYVPCDIYLDHDYVLIIDKC